MSSVMLGGALFSLTLIVAVAIASGVKRKRATSKALHASIQQVQAMESCGDAAAKQARTKSDEVVKASRHAIANVRLQIARLE